MNITSKKIISVIMAVVLTMCIFVVSPFAASATLAVKTDKTSYYQGETVTATVYFPSKNSELASLDLELKYDSSKFEVVSVTRGKELDNAINAQVNGDGFSEGHSKAGVIKWSLAATNNYNFSGTFAVVKLYVKTKAGDGKTTLDLNIKYAMNSGRIDKTADVSASDATVTIVKVAANDLAFELNSSKTGYEVVGYTSYSADSITVPATYAGLPVVAIRNNIFNGHNELKSVVLSAGLETIGEFAFNNCSKLEKIVIPDSVTSIGNGAFKGCTSLTSATLPIGLETVPKNAFNGCSALESIELPFTVTKIESGAFAGCTKLAEVKISRNTKNIAADAFKNCAPLTFRTVSDNTYLPSFISANLPDAKTAAIKDITLGTAKLDKTTVQYTGSAIKPVVTVKLTSGERASFKPVYKNNVKVGKGKVYVAGTDTFGEGYILEFDITCTHKFTKTVGRAASCTIDGYYDCVCTTCGYETQEKIPATGHKEGSWVIDLRPTIFKEGSKHTECTVCKAIIKNNVAVAKAFPDLNADKKINSADALIVLLYSVGKDNRLTTPELLLNADTDGNGTINSADALAILQISIGKITIDGYTA